VRRSCLSSRALQACMLSTIHSSASEVEMNQNFTYLQLGKLFYALEIIQDADPRRSTRVKSGEAFSAWSDSALQYNGSNNTENERHERNTVIMSDQAFKHLSYTNRTRTCVHERWKKLCWYCMWAPMSSTRSAISAC